MTTKIIFTFGVNLIAYLLTLQCKIQNRSKIKMLKLRTNLSFSNKLILFCLIFCTQIYTYNRTDAYKYEVRNKHFDKKTRAVKQNR